MPRQLTQQRVGLRFPQRQPYLTAIQRYRLARERCIVVADSERGLESAVAAGLECLVVLSEWTNGGDFGKAAKVLKSVRCVPDEVLKRASERP